MYSCNLDLPVVFPDPMFPSIDAIKQPDVAADDADDDDVFMHLDNEAVAPIFEQISAMYVTNCTNYLQFTKLFNFY
jgi:hypothetical protein